MKIELKGKYKGTWFEIDDSDLHLLEGWRFTGTKTCNEKVYVKCYKPMVAGYRETTQLHQLLMGTSGQGHKVEIDHIDGNPLNNKRTNLRTATHSQNQMNRGKIKNNTSGFKGVYWHKQYNKWRAYIGINRKRKYLGSFSTPEEAWKAYQKAAKELHGEYRRV